MFIINDDHDVMIDTDAMTSIFKDGENVSCELFTGDVIILGEYENEKTVDGVFDMIISNINAEKVVFAMPKGDTKW